MQRRNARIGFAFFWIFTFAYLAFVGGSAFAPQHMGRAPIAGLSAALLGGLGVIGLAVLLALVYGWICSYGSAEEPNEEAPQRSAKRGQT